MFKQVYCHKTHSAYNLLLEKAMQDLVDEDLLAPPRSLTEYCMLTDDLIMSRVFSETQKNPDRKDWMGAFAKRRLPKLLTVVEASKTDPIWSLSEKQIYEQSDGEKYPGWETDDQLINTSLKAEVIKGDNQKLPLVFHYNKLKNTYESQSFISKSVFFTQQETNETSVRELKDRLNRRLMFFYKF